MITIKPIFRGFSPFKFIRVSYSTNSGLLSDINVLDLSRIIAGPVCTMTLGDLGANVIKVESFEGDEARKWGPPFTKGKDSYYFLSVNRSKKSICVDLKTCEGKSIIYDLAKKCDVVVENFLPGKLDKLEVGYEKLSQVNPKLIYCAITGFGPTGPYAMKPGYDVIAAAMGGFLNSTGERNGRPVKAGVAITDVTTGLHAFGAIMTALYYRRNTGKGQKIDCNLLSTQISSMINIANNYLNCGIEGEKWGTAHANLVPYQSFKTNDGEMVIGTGSNAQFADLCRLMHREDLIEDERFKDNAARVANRDDIIRIISDVIVTKSKKQWLEVFRHASFAYGPVNTMKEVFEDEHVREIKLVKELEHPDAGKIRVVGPPTVYSEGGNEARLPPPKLGQHTRDVLANFLGYHDAKIEGLMQNKVIRFTLSYILIFFSVERVTVITLRPTKQQTRKKVVWTEDTVDNEHMNKKKSKCCCIYEKPRRFDESDSESDDECEHCFGHVEKRKKRAGSSTATAVQEATEQTASITLQPPEPAPAPPDKPSADT
ncbi:succinate--hydroxymethylglutarate CoA-transferase-like [Zerene cesonia]|uniref:succinate--hydroxymethylglutarate CoA-transferase-like n=1 Tax=Zerene cesonia TaxID=33412 RepID=UPI0018E50200|nr:succinate--hydroxymethylglutarate CoA-transferase-like [Zerene cesonia]